MAINLDPAQGASALLPGRPDRHDADARQDRWMFELERAMFSASAKRQRGAAPRQEQTQEPAQQDGSRPNGDVRPVAAAVQSFNSARADLRSAWQGGAHGRLADVDSAEHAHAAQGAREPDDTVVAGAPSAALAAMAATLHTVACVQTSVTVSATEEGRGAIPPGSFIIASASVKLVAAGGSDPASPMEAVQRATAAPLVSLGQFAEPLLPDSGAPALSNLDIPEKSDSRAATLADVAEFEKRLMHLVVGSDGVHAYIRDAELGAAQMRSVALALTAEMAASGQSLAALTVNGQRVSPSTRHVASEDLAIDGLAPLTSDEPSAPSPSFQPIKPVRKGLPE
jgi:hypothetical protein